MSEPRLFTATLLQPPISNTLGKAGAQCAPRKCDCGSCPLARCSLHCADGAGSASAPLPGGRARWRRGGRTRPHRHRQSSAGGGQSRRHGGRRQRQGEERRGSPGLAAVATLPHDPCPSQAGFLLLPGVEGMMGVTCMGWMCHLPAAVVDSAALASLCPTTVQSWPGFPLRSLCSWLRGWFLGRALKTTCIQVLKKA